MTIWEKFTTLEDTKKGAAVLLTVDEGSAEEAVLELYPNDINCAPGLKNVIARLDRLYLKDTVLH